jgi:transcriptional regulator with XRE-family HTH domain
MKFIATNIKVLREEARLTFEDLSEITNIEVSRLKDFEKGKIVPTQKEVEILCKPLRIHYEDIIERDILSERNEAGKKMKKGPYRNNYNWYLGDRRVLALYLTYFLVIVLGLISITLLSKFLGLDLIVRLSEDGTIIPTTYFEAFITAYVIMSYPAGIAFIVWLLIKLRYRFVWWHIFWLSFVITLIPVVGAISMLPATGYSFYKSIIKKGKN